MSDDRLSYKQLYTDIFKSGRVCDRRREEQALYKSIRVIKKNQKKGE